MFPDNKFYQKKKQPTKHMENKSQAMHTQNYDLHK